MNDLFIDCKIKSGNYIIDCSNVTMYIKTLDNGIIGVLYHFFDTTDILNENRMRLTNIDHVEIELFGESYPIEIISFFSDKSIIESYDKTQTMINNLYFRHINTLIIESNTMINQKECINKKQGIFTDTSNDEMIIDCINLEINRTYNCLPIFNSDALIRLERDLDHFGYTICPFNMRINFTITKHIIFECVWMDPDWCEKNIFTITHQSQPTKTNSTKILIYPKNGLITEFQKNYRSDFNDWVYNCGGIIGMWFGYSALSITSLILFIRHNWKKSWLITKKLVINYYYRRKNIKESKKFRFLSINNKQVFIL